MKILVTGGTGFVGRRVVNHLIEQGHEVRMLTRRAVAITGAEVCCVSGLDDKAGMREAVHGVTTICHLAGRAHVLGAPPADHETLFEQVNVDWTRTLAEVGFVAGVRRFVFVSSIGAVGNASAAGQRLTEHTQCLPTTPYGRSKLRAEHALQQVAKQYGGEWVVVRPPLVHGKYAPGNMARLTRLVKMGLPLPLGSVRNARSMIHVDNLADVLASCLTHPSAAGEVFHVRDPRDYATPDILRGLGRSLDKPARLFPMPVSWLRMAGLMVGQSAAIEQLTGSLQVDDSRVRAVLGFEPRDLPFEAE